MSDFPGYEMPVSPILTPFSPASLGLPLIDLVMTLGTVVSTAWPSANLALFYPFRLTSWATAYQLLFFVGATSSGNIDVGIYDSQLHKVVSAGSTAMSATVNTVQELNIADTVLPPGDYLLAGACDNTTGTVFLVASLADELVLSSLPVYQQAGLTAAALTDPAVPVLATASNPPIVAVGIQFRSVF